MIQSGSCEDNPPTSRFRDAVLRAQDDAAEAGITVKDGLVPDELAYTAEIASRLRKINSGSGMGFCAHSGTLADEVWVKTSNTFSEHWDITTADGRAWTHHAATCRPARF